MSFKKRYRDLEMEVFATLGEMISNSEYEAENYNSKAIQIDIDGFIELTIIDGSLTLLDTNGNHYNIFHISLENLIEIIEK